MTLSHDAAETTIEALSARVRALEAELERRPPAPAKATYATRTLELALERGDLSGLRRVLTEAAAHMRDAAYVLANGRNRALSRRLTTSYDAVSDVAARIDELEKRKAGGSAG